MSATFCCKDKWIRKVEVVARKTIKRGIQKVKKKEISFSGVQYSVIHVGH